ncbi:hypothetical protein [Roseovarius sp. EL26]|uniref:hypothetical protein n=1 Tax=Roseovarius sp. EL26 TaxID=2126672 RepID=UPI000EA369B2|nr:hypothetical protein [Roseovarius sp. EL26]
MKPVSKTVIAGIAALSLSLILGLSEVANAADETDINDCNAWQDEGFCSAYRVTMRLTESIITGKDRGADVIIMIGVANEADLAIRYYTTFKLIEALIESREGTLDSQDYQYFKNRLILQLFEYHHSFEDNARAQAYLVYLMFFVDPVGTLPRGDLIAEYKGRNGPDFESPRIRCFVENDLPYLSMQQVEETEVFKECMG